jgi:hypothetical protein
MWILNWQCYKFCKVLAEVCFILAEQCDLLCCNVKITGSKSYQSSKGQRHRMCPIPWNQAYVESYEYAASTYLWFLESVSLFSSFLYLQYEYRPMWGQDCSIPIKMLSHFPSVLLKPCSAFSPKFCTPTGMVSGPSLQVRRLAWRTESDGIPQWHCVFMGSWYTLHISDQQDVLWLNAFAREFVTNTGLASPRVYP